MWWINVITNVKSKRSTFPPKYFTIFDGFMFVTNTLFNIYDGIMFVANNNTIKNIIFFFYYRRTKAITSVNSVDGVSSVIVNNTLFYIYDGRWFVANTNTIKKNIFCIFDVPKLSQVLIVSTLFCLVIINNTLLATNIFMPS